MIPTAPLSVDPVTPTIGSVPIHTPIINVTDSDVNFHKGLIAVIPAYNEQITIGSVVLLARQYVDQVIVVDDGSLDRTSEVAKIAGADIIRLDVNTGKAYAILLGFKRARELNCSAVVMLDADGQHYIHDIPRIAGGVLNGDADLVIGSRFIENKRNTPVYRRFGQIIINILTNFGSRYKVTDSQSGYRALSRKALNYLDFRSDDYNLESDMIAHFVAQGLVIKEVPIDVRYDVPNKHKKHPLKHGIGVLSNMINLISYRRPLLVFGIPGSILLVGGMIAEIWVYVELHFGVYHDVLAIASAFIVVLGLLLLIAGLILNTQILILKERKLQ